MIATVWRGGKHIIIIATRQPKKARDRRKSLQKATGRLEKCLLEILEIYWKFGGQNL